LIYLFPVSFAAASSPAQLNTFGRIEVRDGKRVTHSSMTTILADVLVSLLVPEAVQHVVASVHARLQKLELLEHGLVPDLPPFCFLNDDANPQQLAAQVLIGRQQGGRLLGELLDDERHGLMGDFTPKRREGELHLRIDHWISHKKRQKVRKIKM
jgi:hypothetical protein